MVDIQCEYRRDCIRVAHRVCRYGFDIVDSCVQVERNSVAQAFEDFGAQQQKRTPKNYTRVDSALTVQCLAPAVAQAPPAAAASPAPTATTVPRTTSQPPQPTPSDPALARDPWQ